MSYPPPSGWSFRLVRTTLQVPAVEMKEAWRRCPIRCMQGVTGYQKQPVGSLRVCYLARGDVRAMTKGIDAVISVE
jgi:hypothetical protein